ncbi:MAG TPA: SDR family oxidoreductase [Burkholderiales bacterium]|nr:SDR family oxidoreductase [Burkholderiales bacterium]
MKPQLSVVITGASSGIGRALAMEYAARGATLGLIARREDLLTQLASSLPVRSCAYALNVTDAQALAHAAADFTARVGCPDIVIASAGVSVGTLTEEAMDNAVFEEVMATNVLGTMLTFQPFLEAMRLRRGGTLVGIGSIAGFRGLPGASAYSASKAAVMSYLESLRLELRDSGVAVVTICPGYVATPMTAKNPYRMPFLMDAGKAAIKIADAIDRRSRFYVLPWQMGLVGGVLKRLPRWLYDLLFARAPRKPRRTPAS